MGDENLPEGQLDMFIDYDKEAEEAERRRREHEEFMKPKTCPACGTEVRNGHALHNGHGIDWPELTIGGWPIAEHPNYQGMCEAQWLVRNHIRYGVTTDPKSLDERVARGKELGLDTDQIIADARATLQGQAEDN